MERTFAIIKPDAVRAGCVGSILHRAQDLGLVPERMVLGHLSMDLWCDFYEEHQGRDHFDRLVRFMMSGPSVFLVLRGENAIKAWRALMGDTDPRGAEPWTIRGEYGAEMPANAAHGSDSEREFEREAWFLDHVDLA